MHDTWAELETTLTKLYSLPHNLAWATGKYGNPAGAARDMIRKVQSGMGQHIRREEFRGPHLFLRVTGGPEDNFAYAGAWWFDPDIFRRLEKSYSRIYFDSRDRRRAIRDMLRELLAVSVEYNPITEVWALELPVGERLIGYVAPGTPQKLFDKLPLSAEGNRMLVGRAEQVFLPVKNPLWVRKYASLGLR